MSSLITIFILHGIILHIFPFLPWFFSSQITFYLRCLSPPPTQTHFIFTKLPTWIFCLYHHNILIVHYSWHLLCSGFLSDCLFFRACILTGYFQFCKLSPFLPSLYDPWIHWLCFLTLLCNITLHICSSCNLIVREWIPLLPSRGDSSMKTHYHASVCWPRFKVYFTLKKIVKRRYEK